MGSLIDSENPILLKWKNDYKLRISGTIHIGAHLVQERDFYQQNGFEPVHWVEAIPSVAEEAEKILTVYENQSITPSLLWSKENELIRFNVTSGEGASSSAFDLYLHKAVHPDVRVVTTIEVTTTTLDVISQSFKDFNFLLMDTQGSELEILKGGVETLKNIDYVVCELSLKELYMHAPKLNHVEEYLSNCGFELVAAEINRTVGWGDGLFIRRSKLESTGTMPNDYQIHFFGPKHTLGTLAREIKLRAYRKQKKLMGSTRSAFVKIH